MQPLAIFILGGILGFFLGVMAVTIAIRIGRTLKLNDLDETP